jgi:hypothetical protein
MIWFDVVVVGWDQKHVTLFENTSNLGTFRLNIKVVIFDLAYKIFRSRVVSRFSAISVY